MKERMQFKDVVNYFLHNYVASVVNDYGAQTKKILTGENRRARRKPRRSAIFSTKNSKLNGLELKPGLRGDRLRLYRDGSSKDFLAIRNRIVPQSCHNVCYGFTWND